MTSTIPDSGVALRCGFCGHQGDYFDFCRTPITGDLPAGTHQCPACRRAWRMQAKEKGRWIPGGLYIPPRRHAVQIESVM